MSASVLVNYATPAGEFVGFRSNLPKDVLMVGDYPDQLNVKNFLKYRGLDNSKEQVIRAYRTLSFANATQAEAWYTENWKE